MASRYFAASGYAFRQRFAAITRRFAIFRQFLSIADYATIDTLRLFMFLR